LIGGFGKIRWSGFILRTAPRVERDQGRWWERYRNVGSYALPGRT